MRSLIAPSMDESWIARVFSAGKSHDAANSMPQSGFCPEHGYRRASSKNTRKNCNHFIDSTVTITSRKIENAVMHEANNGAFLCNNFASHNQFRCKAA
jgi:hypothetical protein